LRCNICDRLLSQPRYNRELKAWEPCDTCLEVINECLNDFKDNAVFTDDAEISLGVTGTSPVSPTFFENSS
jgi:hypothetical protein